MHMHSTSRPFGEPTGAMPVVAARGDFFAIDSQAWARVCALGMNAAVAYLVLARGTGGDQRTTSWSVNAVETYTGIGRPRAQKAIKALGQAGLVHVTQKANRPQYSIVPMHEATAKPDWIWLPNTLIDGARGNLAAPVELVRQTRNVAALRLLIDLYHAQSLASDGGIHWRSIRREFIRHKVGEQGAFIIYGFEAGIVQAWGAKPFVKPHMTGEMEAVEGGNAKRDRGWTVFWDAWSLLERLRLVELVGHLVEADTDDAEIIHPYAIENGEAPERRLAIAAHEAGNAALAPHQQEWAEKQGLHLVPVRMHYTEVQMVGIARLKYRPRTSATAAWFSKMPEWDKMAERLVSMASTAGQSRNREAA